MKFINELIEFLFSNFSVDSTTENFQEFKATFIAKKYNPVEQEKLESQLSFLQDRDSIHISITFGESDPVILNSQKTDIGEFIRNLGHEALHLDDEDISLAITINKSVKDAYCTIYDLDSFVNTLKGYDINQFFQTFSKLFEHEQCIYFNVFDLHRPFYTATLSFFPFAENKSPQSVSRRKEIFESFKSHCHFGNIENFYLVPNDFKLSNRDATLTELNDLFDRYSNLLSIIYLFDLTSIIGNSIEYKLNGYKSIKGTTEVTNLYLKEFNEYFDIFDWVYNGGNLYDKIGLARNIISLHLKNINELTLQGNPFQSVKSSFKVYEKQNIKQYIEIRNKISDQLFDFNTRASKIVETFASDFRKSTLALISFYISTIVIRVLSKGDFVNIFSFDATILSLVFLGGSLIYYWGSRWEIKEQKTRFMSSYANLKRRYTDLLEPDDIIRILNNDSEYDQDLLFIERKRKIYSRMWISVVILLASATIFLYSYYNLTQLSDGFIFKFIIGNAFN